MVEVENEAGIGFINNHMVGNLKIVKSSSDGRIEGFSFRVTGENYDEVFKTDANGEIFIEGLRIGKYTVTEVEDEVSAGYKRPDPVEVELVADETLRKQDISGQKFGRLTAIRPTDQRDSNGSVVWELQCDCGTLVYKTVNTLKSGRVLSCGCKYRETRSETVKYRRDMVEGTSVSNIVVSKRLRSNNTSGHTGVGFDKRTGKWYAFINFQKRHYNLGMFKEKPAAIHARREAEAKLHDPVILEYWDSLTEERKKEFQEYLRSTKK